MVSYFFASAASGALFGVLDRLMKENPLAARLYERVKVPVVGRRKYPDAIFVDLVYGAVMVTAYLIVYNQLPGFSPLARGVCFGLAVWFFRTGLQVLFLWFWQRVHPQLLLYALVTGLGQYMAQGLLIGLMVKPLS